MSDYDPKAAVLAVALCLLVTLGAVTALGVLAGAGAPAGTVGANADHGNASVSEERYVQEAPEEGDEYFEAVADDGSWISYDNPRDRYRDPYIGEASGKVCVTLLNEAGEVVVGESVPNTTVTIPTPSLSWHSYADPMVVEFPLTDNYERPLDADQFGTSPDLPQGDGYMDAHCIEFHGPPENKTIEYGEAVVEGEHADRIEVVGYIQQANEAWDTDVDPIEDVTTYEAAGGSWTNRPNESHGQVVVTLQLQPEGEMNDTVEKDPQRGGATTDDPDGGPMDQAAPGAAVAVLALVLLAVARGRRGRS